MSDETNKIHAEIIQPGALEAQERAQIDIQISTAKRYPRELSRVKAAMLSFATLDQETAESCFYSLPRGGKNIQGPSVRLAEIAVSCYQNLRAGARVIAVDTNSDAPHVTVQAIAHDLQSNTSVTIEKRRRITKKKSKAAIDEDDINLAANAGSAIAFRDAVFKVIPMALVKPCYEAAKKVAIGDQKTLGDRRTKAVEAFGKMGITKERVLQRLEVRSIEDITLDHLETLLGLHTAIKDGATNIDEAFPEMEGVRVETGPAPKQSEKPSEPVKTPQAQLADSLIAAGLTFDDFMHWCAETGNTEAVNVGSYDELPKKFAERMCRCTAAIIGAHMGRKGGAK